MAIVNFSLDTKTRQTVLTINGVIVSATDVCLEKYIYDGEEHIRFSYTIDSDGMKERRQFYLPSPEEMAADVIGELNENGFASKILHDDEKAKADIVNFIQRGRNS